MTDADGAGCWFVLWAKDDEFSCPILEERFFVEDFNAIRPIIADEDEAEPLLGSVDYELEPEQVQALSNTFGAGAGFAGLASVYLRSWRSLREVPYLVHTTFELFLMLEGRKPFAHFCDLYPSEWLDEFLEPFERHVQSGRLIRRVSDEPFEEPQQLADGQSYEGSRRVSFALPGEEWRIDAYLLLWDASRLVGWNETLEALEGKLLGYEDWQVEWWLAERRRRQADIARPPTD